MKYNTHIIESENASGIATEIMFETASARASEVELLHLLIHRSEGKNVTKLRSAAIRVLKEMKSRGTVQLFATDESFEKSTTEAKYLTNKYPQIPFDTSDNPDSVCIYVKI